MNTRVTSPIQKAQRNQANVLPFACRKIQTGHRKGSSDVKSRQPLFCSGCCQILEPGQSRYLDADGETRYCAECFEEKVAAFCWKCGDLIRCCSLRHKIYEAEDGQMAHEFCLTCDDCQGSVVEDDRCSGLLYLHGEEKLCAACYDARISDSCQHCKQPINCYSQGHIKYSSIDSQQHWHHYCLLCWHCSRLLAGKTIYWRNDRMFCSICHGDTAMLRRITLRQ